MDAAYSLDASTALDDAIPTDINSLDGYLKCKNACEDKFGPGVYLPKTDYKAIVRIFKKRCKTAFIYGL